MQDYYNPYQMEYSVKASLKPRERWKGSDLIGLEENAESFSYLNFYYYTKKALVCIDFSPRTFYFMSVALHIITPFTISYTHTHTQIHTLTYILVHNHCLPFPCTCALLQDLNTIPSWNPLWLLDGIRLTFLYVLSSLFIS